MPAAAGIYIDICPPWQLLPAEVGIIFEIFSFEIFEIFSKKMLRFFLKIDQRQKKWYIYYIYGVSSGYIQRYSRLDLGYFSSSAKKFPRPPGTALPSEIFLPWTKNNLGLGAISLYIALRDPIYTLHILKFIYKHIYLKAANKISRGFSI